MDSVTRRSAPAPVEPARFWIVELNLPGWRIRRRTRKRRHLLGIGRTSGAI